MKKIIALAIIMAGSSFSALAALYQGTFTYTFTYLSPAVEGVSVGQTFNGWYRYESPTIDGTFSGRSSGIAGQICIPRPFRYAGYETLSMDNLFISLTVTNGILTDFYWHTTDMQLDMNWDFSYVLFHHALYENIRGSGTATWTSPRPIVLSQHLTNDSLVISWPDSAIDFLLENNSDLSNTNGWTTALQTLVTNGGFISITVPISTGNNFYRLKKPGI